MTVGQKIKKLRIEKGLTQKDLADQIHVTFQTVSKWENDENEPDIATIRGLAKLFDCSLDYLLSESEEDVKKQDPTTTVIIHQKELHICERCKKEIPEEELEVVQIPHSHRTGRHTSYSHTDAYYHKECYAKELKEKEQKLKEFRISEGKRIKKLAFGWGIPLGIVALVATLLCLLIIPACKAIFHPGIAVLLAVVAGYGVFATLYCIITRSYIEDVFLGVGSWSIKFPGLIFTFDIDGFAWLIAMKILFAILGFMFSVGVIVLAAAVSFILSIFSFPFVLIHNNHIGYYKED